MNQKNKSTRICKLAVFLVLMVFVLTGCAGGADPFIEKEVNPGIDVFGVGLLMDEQTVHEILDAQGEKAMCIYGYEYEFSDRRINIGFNSETKKVRRVTTKNPETSIFGIKPGMELAKAYASIESNGFTKDEDSKYKFSKENIIFSIISMKGTHADGLTIEIDPDQT